MAHNMKCLTAPESKSCIVCGSKDTLEYTCDNGKEVHLCCFCNYDLKLWGDETSYFSLRGDYGRTGL